MSESTYSPEKLAALKDSVRDDSKAHYYHDEWQQILKELDQLRTANVLPTDQQTRTLMMQAKELVTLHDQHGTHRVAHTSTHHNSPEGLELRQHYGFDISDDLYQYYQQAWLTHVAPDGFTMNFS